MILRLRSAVICLTLPKMAQAPAVSRPDNSSPTVKFHLALGGNGAGGSAASSVAVWGKGDFSRFRGSGSDGVVIHNAEVLSGYLGVDFHWRSDILLGLAVSYSDGEGDYST